MTPWGKGAIGLCLALLTATSAPARAEPRAPPAATASEPQQVLVLIRLPPAHYRPNSAYTSGYGDKLGEAGRRRIGERLARRYGLTPSSQWAMPLLGLDCVVLDVPAGASPEAAVARMAHDPDVVWSQPMNVYRGEGRASPHTDPLFRAEPAAAEWRLAALHELSTGRNVRVAVIDSMIDRRHPDLLGQVAASEDFVPERPSLGEAHGTGVAGVIAAADNGVGVIGVAPDARLIGLRACWQTADGAVCNTLTLAKALYAAITQRAQVINMSLSGPADPLLGRLIDTAIARGAVVVAAYDRGAPNGGFPASHPGAVAVADEASGQPRAGVYLAPGRDVPTAQPEDRWALVNGSSYAAAHVSGLLALVRQRNASPWPPALVPARSAKGEIDACASAAR